MQATRQRVSVSLIIVHLISWMGVAVWAYLALQRILDGFPSGSWLVFLLAIILGGSHLAISLLIGRRPTIALGLTVFIFVADVLLGLLVNPKAFVLALASVVLFLAVWRVRTAAVDG